MNNLTINLQKYADFLSHPSEEALSMIYDQSGLLVWIDWRECEEDLIHYFNTLLPEADRIVCETKDIDKPRGIDIILKSDEKEMIIPFADDVTDRDSAIRAMQEIINPKYQIRWFMESLGGDTLAFALLATEQWEELEQQFSKSTVDYYFQLITSDSVMFEMSVNEMFELMDARAEQAPNTVR